jgi:hypothetical protein
MFYEANNRRSTQKKNYNKTLIQFVDINRLQNKMQRGRFCCVRLQTVKLSLKFKTWEGTESVSEVGCVEFKQPEGGGFLMLLFYDA